MSALAAAKGCSTNDITVCVLERPRHEAMIEELRATGAAIRLEDLRYWSVDWQEAYASPEAVLLRVRRAGRG